MLIIITLHSKIPNDYYSFTMFFLQVFLYNIRHNIRFSLILGWRNKNKPKYLMCLKIRESVFNFELCV